MPRLVGRPLARVVLAAFLVLPALGAWLLLDADATPCPVAGRVISKRASPSRKTSTAQTKPG